MTGWNLRDRETVALSRRRPRQRDDHRRSVTRRARGADVAAVREDETARDRQAEARPVRPRALVEALERATQLLLRHSRSAVANLDGYRAVRPGDADVDASAGRRVPQRVREQIAQHLANAQRIDGDRRHV